MKDLGLSAPVGVRKGGIYVPGYNIFVPNVVDALEGLSDALENADFATFQGETQKSGDMPPGAASAVGGSGDKPRKRRKLLKSEVFFGSEERCLPSFSGAWVEVERDVSPQLRTRYAVEVDTYDDGTEYSKLLTIENPKGVYVHEYRKDLYKVVLMVDPVDIKSGGSGKAVGKPEEERWKSSLSRARISIEEYGLCNSWDYFVTLTIDGEKLARSDLENFRKKLQQMMRDLRRNDGTEIQYLFVPELHPVALDEGRIEWHIHGLMKMPRKYLVPFENKPIYGKDGNKRPPKYIRDKLSQGQPVFYWKQFNRAFGYSIVEPVRDWNRSVRYLMKYVSKEQGKTAQHLEKGQNLYYHSTGLQRAKKVPSDTLARNGRVGVAVSSSGEKLTLAFVKRYPDCIIEWWQK